MPRLLGRHPGDGAPRFVGEFAARDCAFVPVRPDRMQARVSELRPILDAQPAVIGMIVVDDYALIRVEKRTLQIIGYADAMLVTLEMAYGVAVCVEGDQVLGLCQATTTYNEVLRPLAKRNIGAEFRFAPYSEGILVAKQVSGRSPAAPFRRRCRALRALLALPPRGCDRRNSPQLWPGR